MSQHVIALDQGTTSSRAIIFDVNGKVVSLSQHPFAQIYPQPGWVEHDPMTILYTQLESLSEAFRTSGLSAADIAAVGITNQRETTIVWEKETGRPVYNAIVWQCRRTAPLCEELRADGWEEKIREKTGLLIDAYFSGTKLRWILDNVPGGRAGLRYRGFLAHLESDRRARPCDRLQQRFPHDALQYTYAAMGRRALRSAPNPDVHAPEAGVQLRRVRHDRLAYAGARGALRHADLRRGGRPAGGTARAGLHSSGRGEKHLRHRLLCHDEHRPDRPGEPKRASLVCGVEHPRRDELLSRGQRIQCRQHRAVDAR